MLADWNGGKYEPTWTLLDWKNLFVRGVPRWVEVVFLLSFGKLKPWCCGTTAQLDFRPRPNLPSEKDCEWFQVHWSVSAFKGWSSLHYSFFFHGEVFPCDFYFEFSMRRFFRTKIESNDFARHTPLYMFGVCSVFSFHHSACRVCGLGALGCETYRYIAGHAHDNINLHR